MKNLIMPLVILLTGLVRYPLMPSPARAEKKFAWPAMLPAIISARPATSSCVQGNGGFTVCSTSFVHMERLADRYTLYGSNVSPQLSWSHAPAGTVYYGIYVYDVDAPGGNWVHWVCLVPASVNELPENSGAAGGGNLPAGSERFHNSFFGQGVPGAAGTDYDGPRPPAGSGVHRYFFSVAPLDSSKQYIGEPVALIGLYSKE